MKLKTKDLTAPPPCELAFSVGEGGAEVKSSVEVSALVVRWLVCWFIGHLVGPCLWRGPKVRYAKHGGFDALEKS